MSYPPDSRSGQPPIPQFPSPSPPPQSLSTLPPSHSLSSSNYMAIQDQHVPPTIYYHSPIPPSLYTQYHTPYSSAPFPTQAAPLYRHANPERIALGELNTPQPAPKPIGKGKGTRKRKGDENDTEPSSKRRKKNLALSQSAGTSPASVPVASQPPPMQYSAASPFPELPGVGPAARLEAEDDLDEVEDPGSWSKARDVWSFFQTSDTDKKPLDQTNWPPVSPSTLTSLPKSPYVLCKSCLS